MSSTAQLDSIKTRDRWVTRFPDEYSAVLLSPGLTSRDSSVVLESTGEPQPVKVLHWLSVMSDGVRGAAGQLAVTGHVATVVVAVARRLFTRLVLFFLALLFIHLFITTRGIAVGVIRVYRKSEKTSVSARRLV